MLKSSPKSKNRPNFYKPVSAVLLLILSLWLLVGCTEDGSSQTSPRSKGVASEISVASVTIDKPAKHDMAAVRMRVTNDTEKTQVLTSVRTGLGDTMLHRSVEKDGHTFMNEVKELEIKPGETEVFGPSGLHVMITGITKDLKVGNEEKLELIFENHDPVSVTAKVTEVQVHGN